MPNDEQAAKLAEALESALFDITQAEPIDRDTVMLGLSVFVALAVRNTVLDGGYHAAIEAFCAETVGRAKMVFDAGGQPFEAPEEPPAR